MISFSPYPAHRLGENGSHMLAAVGSVAPYIFIIVTFEFQRRLHGHVSERPVAVLVVEVVDTLLEKAADGFLFGFPDEAWVGIAATDVGEGTDG